MSLKDSKKMTGGKLFDNLIQSYKEINPKSFISRANSFLKIYPYNVHIHFLRGLAFQKLGMLNESLLNIEFAYYYDTKNNNAYLKELFFLYYHLRHYDKALGLLSIVKKRKIIDEENLDIMNLVIKNSLNILSFQEKIKIINIYSKLQIIDYSYKDALLHLQNHQYGYDYSKSQFKSGVNFEYLLNLIQNNLKNSKRNFEKVAMDIYYFGISSIGYDNDGEVSNYIKVVVAPNTENIITMFLVSKIPNEFTNLEYDQEKLFNSIGKIKAKKMSQIDKFNRRYKQSTE